MVIRWESSAAVLPARPMSPCFWLGESGAAAMLACPMLSSGSGLILSSISLTPPETIFSIFSTPLSHYVSLYWRGFLVDESTKVYTKESKVKGTQMGENLLLRPTCLAWTMLTSKAISTWW